jgi:hypothetical protein
MVQEGANDAFLPPEGCMLGLLLQQEQSYFQALKKRSSRLLLSATSTRSQRFYLNTVLALTGLSSSTSLLLTFALTSRVESRRYS